MGKPVAAFLLASLLLCGVALADGSIAGHAKVIDGSTIEIDGALVSFAGVMAPARQQSCQREGVSWPCGEVAAERLEALIGNQTVQCSLTGRDMDDRQAGVCFAGTVELSRAMVAEGLAISRWKFGIDYAESESVAKTARIGLWSGTFVEPWVWRQQHSEPAKPVS
jgi:endonuclease YncB( thermonuclease family)